MSVYTTTYGPVYGGSAAVPGPDLVLPQFTVEAGMIPAAPVSGAGTLILDDAASGLLDTNTLGSGTAWTDISAYVLGFTITRPSSRQQGPLLAFQAGTATVTLDNSDGRFDPDNLSGPYAAGGVSQVRAMVPVRIRAVFGNVLYPLFGGFADGWLETAVDYEAGYSEVTLAATDGFKVLAGITLPAVALTGAGAATGARVNDILNRAGWYTGTEKRSVAAGDSTLQGTTLGDSALNLMQVAVDSEIGQLYCDGAGKVTFRNRRSLITGTRSAKPQGYFGDQPGAVTHDSQVGAWLDWAAMGAADWEGGATAWAAWTGDPVTLRRDYFGPSDFTIYPRLTQAIADGVKMCITLKPAYNPVSATDLASLGTMLSTLKAAGLEAEICLWSEPFYEGLSSAQYIAMYQYYGPTIRAYYPLVFVTSESTVWNNGENSYYPGDAYVDKVATHFYCINYVNGHSLDLASSVADGANPPKPFGLWEYNALVNGGNFLFQPNCGFELASTGTWTNSGNCAIASSSTQAHTGSWSLRLTSSAAGNMSAAHCLAADITTQGLSCTSGDSIAASAWFRAQSAGRSCNMQVSFYTSGGVFISSLGVGAVTDTTSGWTQGTGTVTAPATSAWCRGEPLVVSTAAGGEQHYVDDVSVSNLSQGYSSSQVTAFFGYIQGYMTARSGSGKLNADLLFFNGPGVNSTEVTAASDFRVALQHSLTAALNLPAATLELPVAAFGRADDDTTIANDVQATRLGGTLQEVTDTTSQALFLFPRTYARSDLILQTDVDALSWAQWVLYVSKSGENRFDSIAVDPQAQAADLWPQVLGREMGDRLRATKRPLGIPAVTKDGFVTGITHTFDAGTSEWLTTWGLQDASKYGSFFTLGNAVTGTLNHNALAY